MENKIECQDTTVCKENVVQLTKDIEKFSKRADAILKDTNELAKKAESFSENVCGSQSSENSSFWTPAGLFSKKVDLYKKIGQKSGEVALDAGKSALEMGEEGAKVATKNAGKVIESTENLGKSAYETASILSSEGIQKGEKIIGKLDEAGEDFSKVYVESMENATDTIGQYGGVAASKAQDVGTGIVSSLTGMFASESNVKDESQKCIDLACQKAAENVIGILKARKKSADKNEEIASKLKLTAEDFVKSLDSMIQESKDSQHLILDAIVLAERISKNDCTESIESGKDKIESSSKDVNNGFLSSAKIGLASAHYKYNDVRENIIARFDKVNLATCLKETGFFMSGLTLGMFSGYLIGYACLKTKKCVPENVFKKKQNPKEE